MTVDLAVVGAPFLDLTFEGMERVPAVGEELVATDLHVAPGGSGMQAVGAARLGLTTAIIAPIGDRGPSALVRASLEAERVLVAPRTSARGADAGIDVTALLSTRDGVAMATALASSEPTRDDIASVRARAMLLSLGRLPLAPPGATAYAVTGALEITHIEEVMLRQLERARALILNEAEATALTGERDPEAAARALGERVATAVVTTGARGAVAVGEEGMGRADAPSVDVVDATGAGDLFAAAYVWADMHSAALADRIAWACLYAGLSVRAPNALAGALDLDAALRAGSERGLRPPPKLQRRTTDA